jgi:hypothetical protein
MKEELRQEIQRKISESFDRARVATPKPVIDEERLRKQREDYAELLFRSALRQLNTEN